MDYFQKQAYIGVFVGITVVISLHNMIVSIFFVFGVHMTPHIATLPQCVSFQYMAAIDKWIGIILFVIRTCLAVPQLGLQRPELQTISEINLIGKSNQGNNKRNQEKPTKIKTNSLLTIDTIDSPSQFLQQQHEKRSSFSDNDEIIEEPLSQNNWDFNNEKIGEES
ncbi:unnamed protein product [Rhizophagus irregularis]|nr:unnamed protein product [Rhizophagus irregularis]